MGKICRSIGGAAGGVGSVGVGLSLRRVLVDCPFESAGTAKLGGCGVQG